MTSTRKNFNSFGENNALKDSRSKGVKDIVAFELNVKKGVLTSFNIAILSACSNVLQFMLIRRAFCTQMGTNKQVKGWEIKLK